MDEDKEDDLKAKRPPGRPRKTPLKKPEPLNGISDIPLSESNFTEFKYDRPAIFKKIWQHLKLMAVGRLQLIFKKDCVIMWGRDHHKMSQLRIDIDTSNINHYYINGEVDIGVTCKNLEIVMTKVDKTYSSIGFLSKVGQTQDNLRVILKNAMQIDEMHKVKLVGDYDRMEDGDMFLNESAYTLKFTLPGKYFKKMLTDIKNFSTQVAICQDGPDKPLTFEYLTSNKQVEGRNVVRVSEKIKFVSKLKPGETFRCAFKVEAVRPISSALLSELITIHAHESLPLLFTVKMDSTSSITIRILTDIIDDRVSDD